MAEQPHRIFKGEDYERILPWLTVYADKSNEINRVATHAINNRHDAYTLEELFRAMAERRQPQSMKPVLEICPATLLMLPTLLRDAADMCEDLAKQIGVEQAKAWEPNKNALR